MHASMGVRVCASEPVCGDAVVQSVAQIPMWKRLNLTFKNVSSPGRKRFWKKKVQTLMEIPSVNKGFLRMYIK